MLSEERVDFCLCCAPFLRLVIVFFFRFFVAFIERYDEIHSLTDLHASHIRQC